MVAPMGLSPPWPVVSVGETQIVRDGLGLVHGGEMRSLWAFVKGGVGAVANEGWAWLGWAGPGSSVVLGTSRSCWAV